MMDIKKNVNLSIFTSWLIGGPADYFALPNQIEDLVEMMKWANEKSLPVTVLGGGSNVLISDRGIRGLTICLKKMNAIQHQESEGLLKIVADAGTGKSELLRLFLKFKLPAALFLAGLPGDVGGGVVMNAGVGESMTPREFVEIVEWVEVLKPDFTIRRYEAGELDWTYRHCAGWEPGIIVRVGISYSLQLDPDILMKVRDANKVRLTKQPLDLPSCGSVFKNPDGHKAAQLIDSCGLKGLAIGGAQVSLKHANFIVNTGGATAQQTWDLICFVKKTVFDSKGVDLSTEVRRLGDWSV